MSTDVSRRLKIGIQREIIECYGGTYDPDAAFTSKDAEAAIRFIAKFEYAWVIDVGGFIGHIRFYDINNNDRRAIIAIGIESDRFTSRGYGTEAANLALEYLFGQDFHRVSLRVLASNARAIASYRKCGLVEEGREREAAHVNGAWVDDLIMGLLARDHAQHRSKI